MMTLADKRLVSIITVCYNSAVTIDRTIKSVLAQNYDNIEYIIIDGASQDNTLERIENYQEEFRDKFNREIRIISEPDKGIYDAMNKGFRMATGEIIGIINSDDLIAETTAIEKIVRCFEANSSVDAVYADLYYVAQSDTSKIVRYWKSGKQRPFAKGWHPAHPTFYVKKVVYEKSGLFDLGFKFAADFELMLRLIEKEHIKLYYLPEALVRMRLGGTTSKSLSNIIKGNIECVEAFRKNRIRVSCLYPLFRLFPKIKQYFQ